MTKPEDYINDFREKLINNCIIDDRSSILLDDIDKIEDIYFINQIYIELGEFLRNCRSSRKMSIGQLCKVTGIAKSTIVKIENGTIPGGPKLITISKILLAFGRKPIWSSEEIFTIKPPLSVLTGRKEDHGSSVSSRVGSLSVVHSPDNSANEGRLQDFHSEHSQKGTSSRFRGGKNSRKID